MQMEILSMEQLNHKIKMYLKRRDKPTSGQMTYEEDLDEFDRILL